MSRFLLRIEIPLQADEMTPAHVEAYSILNSLGVVGARHHVVQLRGKPPIDRNDDGAEVVGE